MNIPTTTTASRTTPRAAPSPISVPLVPDLTGAWVDEETVPVPVPVGEEVVLVPVELEAAA